MPEETSNTESTIEIRSAAQQADESGSSGQETNYRPPVIRTSSENRSGKLGGNACCEKC